MRRRLFLTGVLGTSAALLMGHSPYRKWYQYRARHTVIVTDRSDARSFSLGERLASRFNDRRPDLKAIAARGQDARTLLSLLKSRQLDLALLRAEDAYQGLHGTGPYASLVTPLRALAALAPEYLHVVVPAPSPIRAIADLSGERVGIIEDGGRARAKAQRVAGALGLDPERDIRWESLAAGEAVSALAASRVVAFCLEGPPVDQPALAAGTWPAELRLRFVSYGNAVPLLVARYGPIYFRATLRANRYEDVATGVDVLGEARVLVCRDDYPADKARALSDAVAGWEELAPAEAPFPVPLHPAVAASRDGPH